mgnify:CR=1 FL=1
MLVRSWPIEQCVVRIYRFDEQGSAVYDAKRDIRLIEQRGHSAEHPILANIPVTRYLEFKVEVQRLEPEQRLRPESDRRGICEADYSIPSRRMQAAEP